MVYVNIRRDSGEILYNVNNETYECDGFIDYEISDNGVVTIFYGDENDPCRLVFPFVNCVLDIDNN